jgi:hypothetical protein
LQIAEGVHPSGSHVQGAIIVLDLDDCKLDTLTEWIWIREGKPSRKALKVMSLGGFDQVLFMDIVANILDRDLTPAHLARLAIRSVGTAGSRNGIRYLQDNIDRAIITPLTYAYRDAILGSTHTSTLAQAEAVVVPGKVCRNAE